MINIETFDTMRPYVEKEVKTYNFSHKDVITCIKCVDLVKGHNNQNQQKQNKL